MSFNDLVSKEESLKKAQEASQSRKSATRAEDDKPSKDSPGKKEG